MAICSATLPSRTWAYHPSPWRDSFQRKSTNTTRHAPSARSYYRALDYRYHVQTAISAASQSATDLRHCTTARLSAPLGAWEGVESSALKCTDPTGLPPRHGRQHTVSNILPMQLHATRPACNCRSHQFSLSYLAESIPVFFVRSCRPGIATHTSSRTPLLICQLKQLRAQSAFTTSLNIALHRAQCIGKRLLAFQNRSNCNGWAC